MQAKINLQSFKSTPDSLKQHLKAFDRKRSLGAPEYRTLNGELGTLNVTGKGESLKGKSLKGEISKMGILSGIL